jgi:hypothetical protein
MRLVLLTVATALVLPAQALAEIYKCDGKWTNQPCSGNVESTLDEVTRSEPAAADEAPAEAEDSSHPAEPLAPRYDALRKLRKLSDEYKRQKLTYISPKDFEAVKKICMDRARPFKECEGAVNQAKDRVVQANTPKE